MDADFGTLSAVETFTYGTPRSTVTTGKTITAGNTVDVIFFTANGDTVTSVTDSNGNTYTSLTSCVDTNNGNKVWVYRKENAAGGANTTWTVTMSSGGVVLIAAIEFTGVPTSSVNDGAPVTVFDSATPFSNSFTTTAGGLVVAIAAVISGSGSTTFSVGGGSGFTKALENTSTWKLAVAKLTPAAATTAYDPAWTQTTDTYAALITYGVKASGGGASVLGSNYYRLVAGQGA